MGWTGFRHGPCQSRNVVGDMPHYRVSGQGLVVAQPGAKRFQQPARTRAERNHPRVQGRISEAEHRFGEKWPEAQAKLTDTAKSTAEAARSKLNREKEEGPAGTPTATAGSATSPTLASRD